MFFRNQVVNPEVCVADPDKVVETHEAISVRPMGYHLSGCCLIAIVPAFLTGGIIALLDMIFDHKSLAPLYGTGCVFMLFYVHYHIWNFRRKRGAHNMVINKVLRRIHLRDLKSRRRVTFPFDHVESITDRHAGLFGEDEMEFIRFSLCGEWLDDHNPLVSHFKRENAHPMSLWKEDHIESGNFGDLLAEIIGCPITHTK